MIDIDRDNLKIIKNILMARVPDCEILIFGSRVTGQASPYSDVDLALVGEGPIDRQCLDALKDDFAESDLPFMVDVLDWYAISEPFRQVIINKFEVLDKNE